MRQVRALVPQHPLRRAERPVLLPCRSQAAVQQQMRDMVRAEGGTAVCEQFERWLTASVQSFGRLGALMTGRPLCSGGIIKGEIVNLDDKCYHPEHFKCKACDKPISEKYIVHDGARTFTIHGSGGAKQGEAGAGKVGHMRPGQVVSGQVVSGQEEVGLGGPWRARSRRDKKSPAWARRGGLGLWLIYILC